jgi:hypothetical protein
LQLSSSEPSAADVTTTAGGVFSVSSSIATVVTAVILSATITAVVVVKVAWLSVKINNTVSERLHAMSLQTHDFTGELRVPRRLPAVCRPQEQCGAGHRCRARDRRDPAAITTGVTRAYNIRTHYSNDTR